MFDGRWWIKRLVDSSDRPRVILSAADAGAAHLISAVLYSLNSDSNIEVVSVLAQEPANHMLRSSCIQNNVPLKTLKSGRFTKDDAVSLDIILSEIKILIKDERPNTVITGLSGPNLGVDEALICLAKENDWLAYSLQDESGWVVQGVAGPAPNYFVQNARNAAETETKAGILRAISVGSLKLLNYREEEIAKFKSIKFEPGITFLGQPLWHLDSYKRTILDVVEAASKSGLGPIVYRQHPLEINTPILQMISENLILEKGEIPFEETILSRSILASCFSTGLRDAVIISQFTKRPIPNVVYCLHHKEIRQSYEKNSQPIKITISQQPYSYFALKKDELFSANFSVSRHNNNNNKTFDEPRPKLIIETIKSDWNDKKYLPQNYAADSKLDSKGTRKKNYNDVALFSSLDDALKNVAKRKQHFSHVLPSQEGNHYLKTELEKCGEVFIKTIHGDHFMRMKNAICLEKEISKKCKHVAPPITTQPLSLGFDNRYALIWPWIDGRTPDTSDSEELRTTGQALGSLHNTLKEIDFSSSFAIERTGWIMDKFYDLKSSNFASIPRQIRERYPWLKNALKEVSFGINETFRSMPRQLIHGDLNPGNVLRTDDKNLMFIDFEEAVQSYLPTFFDVATMLERLIMFQNRNSNWQDSAAKILEAYLSETNTRIPYANCFFDARCFSIVRSVMILIESEKLCRPWPESEWKKFELLSENVLEQAKDLNQLLHEFL